MVSLTWIREDLERSAMASDDAILAALRGSQFRLLELQSKYHAFGDNYNSFLSLQLQDLQTFLDLAKHVEDLECNITTLATRVQILSQEKLELQEEVNELRERLVVAEDNCIQLEAEKQETDFLLQLVTSEKEELLSRFSQEPFNDLFNGEDLPLLALKNVPSSSRKSLNATCMKRGKPGRRKTMFRLGDCKENSFTACGSAKKNGDMTVFLDQSMILDADDLDLEELTDKLSWYESVMHQLQDILGAQLDDPDADYQQESWKIVERAKRMVEYKVMIRDYETIISEMQEKIGRLERCQVQLLKKLDDKENMPPPGLSNSKNSARASCK